MEESSGLVVFGDVVGSRRDSAAASAWLRELVVELDDSYRDDLLAGFAFTQGDELQGLLKPAADPFGAMLRAALSKGSRPVRWVIVRGAVDPGEGPAIERTGDAFLTARKALETARAGRERLIVSTGRPEADALLNDMGPALVDMLDGVTPTQREVARMAVIEGLRQSEVAERVGKRRATVSVSFARAKVVPLVRLVAAMRRIYAGPVVGSPS
jgi:hypothetical protein